MPGGYCLDDGVALEKLREGVWQCPDCGRRAPAVSTASSFAFEGLPVGAAVCPDDGTTLLGLRGDVWECPRCRRRQGRSTPRPHPGDGAFEFGTFHQSPLPGKLTALAADRDGCVLAVFYCRGAQALLASSRALASRTWPPPQPVAKGVVTALTWTGGATWVIGEAGRLSFISAGPAGMRATGDSWPATPVGVWTDGSEVAVLELAGDGARVRTLDFSGRQVSSVQLDMVRTPAGLCTSELARGSDFVVADRASGQVVWFSRKGRRLWEAPGTAEGPTLRGACSLWRRPDEEELFVACRDERAIAVLDAVGMEVQRQTLPFAPSAITATDRFVVVGDEEEAAVWVAPLSRTVAARRPTDGKGA